MSDFYGRKSVQKRYDKGVGKRKKGKGRENVPGNQDEEKYMLCSSIYRTVRIAKE